jgi:N-acetylglucosamine-6-phosphate deacetylase
MGAAKLIGRDPHTGRTLSILIEDGGVTHIEETSQQSDLYLSAGLVDLQINGFAGHDLNTDNLSVETVNALVDVQLAHGVTCFAPTLITADEGKICTALRAIKQARLGSSKIANVIPYVHVEGPHISPLNGYRGAHPLDAIRSPSIPEFDRWQKSSNGLVGLVTFSPHYPNSEEYIAHLVSQKVHVAIGHTHATPEQIRRAVDAGARLSTHLGNGISSEIPRHSNPIWSQLADPRLTATVIADGHHLPPELLQVILRSKGLQQTVLVSDAVALAGMPAGIYNTPVGGSVELRSDGKLCLFGTDLLAGSTDTLAHCVSHIIRTTGTSLSDALTMATTNPGRFTEGRGQLAVDRRADLIRFRVDNRNEIEIEDVWLKGENVYARQSTNQPIKEPSQ